MVQSLERRAACPWDLLISYPELFLLQKLAFLNVPIPSMKFLLFFYFLIEITSKDFLESLSGLVCRNYLLFLWEKYLLVILFLGLKHVFPKGSYVFHLSFCSKYAVRFCSVKPKPFLYKFIFKAVFNLEAYWDHLFFNEELCLQYVIIAKIDDTVLSCFLLFQMICKIIPLLLQNTK